jgi:hypothetical protein
MQACTTHIPDARVCLTSKLNVDGGSENWNKTVFAFFADLVSRGVFDKVELLRFHVGHTHSDQDQKFSRVSIALHGYGNEDVGMQCLTPEEWSTAVRNCFSEELYKPDVVPVSSVFDFHAFYHDNMEILEGFGAACEATAAPGEQPRMDEERYSHFRFALITKDSIGGMASIRFAEDCFSAKRGEFFPAPRAAGADPLAPLDYCTLDKRGAPVLKALPEGEPTRVQYWPGHWKYHENFMETLSALGQSVQWPSAARQAWADYIQEPPCRLGVPWDPESLAQPPSAQSAAPRFDSIASRRLVMCPLVTGTRTRVMKRNEQAGVLGLRRGQFNVAFEDLEVGDMAFALAWQHAPNAFRPFVRGKQTKPVELLEIIGITSKPNKLVGWRYWHFHGRANGTYQFVPLMEGGKRKEMWHPYQDPTKPGQSEMLIVWHDDVDERRLVDNVYTLGIQQLHDLHTWCVPSVTFHTVVR